MALIQITEFTDPGCPYAWSAEPFRRRLQWLYGDQIEWRLRMVVLADSGDEYVAKGFTPEKLSAAVEKLSREHGMPIDTSLRDRMSATAPACRAVVATRLNAPESEAPLLRALRVHHVAGEHLEDRSTREAAARDAGLEPARLESWMVGDDVERALEEDKAAARNPTAAALALDHKLAPWPGGRRYTCPSYEVVRLDDGVRLDLPGFQPWDVYEAALANLAPEATRRDPRSPCSNRSSGRASRSPRARSRSSATSPTTRRASGSGMSRASAISASTGCGRPPDPPRGRPCSSPAGGGLPTTAGTSLTRDRPSTPAPSRSGNPAAPGIVPTSPRARASTLAGADDMSPGPPNSTPGPAGAPRLHVAAVRPLRVLIADDDPLVRVALQDALSGSIHVAVAGAADTGRSAIELAAQLAPDVVLMDPELPDIDGITAMLRIRRDNPETAS